MNKTKFYALCLLEFVYLTFCFIFTPIYITIYCSLILLHMILTAIVQNLIPQTYLWFKDICLAYINIPKSVEEGSVLFRMYVKYTYPGSPLEKVYQWFNPEVQSEPISTNEQPDPV
jgi:hypothetical protein